MRRYWQPVALSEELPPERPAKAVRILSEDLVLFRDEEGRLGLIDRHCAHRAADLSYGRLEDGGLRCCYHGWLYNVEGQCLEQPAEPAGSRFHEKVRIKAYPCQEANGIIYTYMGPGEPPLIPAFDWNLAPEEYVFVFKAYQEANWLQANEGEIDPSHFGYLHRLLDDEPPEGNYVASIELNEAAESDVLISRIAREQRSPQLEMERTDYGLRIYTLRDIDAERKHLRVTNFLFPNAAIIAIGEVQGLVQWHVPIDDEHNWRYDIFYSYREPIDKVPHRQQKLDAYALPEYRSRRNRANNYGYDPEEQKKYTFLGMGFDFNTHDTWAIEGLGPIQDRTREHLGTTDKIVIAARQMLLKAIREMQEGGEPPGLVRDPAQNHFDHLVTIDTATPSGEWGIHWRNRHAARRRESPWASKLEAVRLSEA